MLVSRCPCREAPKPIYLTDYAPPDYNFSKVALDFNLGEEVTTVASTISVEPTYDASRPSRPLFLNGDPCVELTGIGVNGAALAESAYTLTPKGLTITAPPTDPFTLTITTAIKPQDNTELEAWPARYCSRSPSHRVPFDSRHEGSYAVDDLTSAGTLCVG